MIKSKSTITNEILIGLLEVLRTYDTNEVMSLLSEAFVEYSESIFWDKENMKMTSKVYGVSATYTKKNKGRGLTYPDGMPGLGNTEVILNIINRVRDLSGEYPSADKARMFLEGLTKAISIRVLDEESGELLRIISSTNRSSFVIKHDKDLVLLS